MKDQFIIAYITDLDNANTVCAYTSYLSQMLRKGLILLYITDPRYKCLDNDSATQKLQLLTKTVHNSTYCAIKGKTAEIIEKLPTALNAVAVVAQVDSNAARHTPSHYKELLHNFANCKIAYLTIQNDSPRTIAFSNVVMTVDYHKESKEKLIWTSYFARFNRSQIHILSQHYKDSGLFALWRNNMNYLQKFFDNLSISFQKTTIPEDSAYPDIDALRIMNDNHYDLMVCTTTPPREKDVLEWFTGTQEERTIRNSYHIPILFINPRSDLYVLCD